MSELSTNRVDGQVPDSRERVVGAQRRLEAEARAKAPTIDPPSAERVAALRAIAASLPGAYRHSDRVLEALRLGTLTVADEGALGTYHLAARVRDLRHKRGINIVTTWARAIGTDGEVHRIGVYALVRGAEASV